MKMVALTMVGPKEEMEPIAHDMVMSGIFQPIPIDMLVSDRSMRSRISTETTNPYDELLTKITAIWRVAGEDIPQPRAITLDEGFSYSEAKRRVFETTGKLEEWEKSKSSLTDELDRLKAAREMVIPLSRLKIRPDELAKAHFLDVYFGRLTPEGYDRLIESTEESPMLTVELSRSIRSVWVLIFTVPGFRENAEIVLSSVYLKEHSLERAAAILSDSDPTARMDEQISVCETKLTELERAASTELSRRREEFEKLYSTIYTMQRVYELCRGRGELGGMFVLSGWMPMQEYERICAKIEKEAPRIKIVSESVEEISKRGARVPSMLKNNPLVRAFQDIVAMYSVPAYGEIDPSPFVAATFILFFGFMFGDIGHGALLMFGAWLLRKKGILSAPLAFVMKCASVSSMVFGLLYGSVMGVEDLFPAVWLSPMHDTGTLFGVSILMGIVMMTVGMVLNVIVKFRDGEYGKMLFDGQGVSGIIFYWCVAGAAAISVLGLDSPISTNVLWAIAGVSLLTTIFRGKLEKILFGKEPHKESGAAFEVIHSLMNYFTNTASFVRLAAFALNHVALSFAVMLISDMLGGLPGGAVLKGIMLAIGNVFIVGLEGLIVFIQVLRLEYYEFFSKFFKGGGSAFKPVLWDERAK